MSGYDEAYSLFQSSGKLDRVALYTYSDMLDDAIQEYPGDLRSRFSDFSGSIDAMLADLPAGVHSVSDCIELKAFFHWLMGGVRFTKTYSTKSIFQEIESLLDNWGFPRWEDIAEGSRLADPGKDNVLVIGSYKGEEVVSLAADNRFVVGLEADPKAAMYSEYRYHYLVPPELKGRISFINEDLFSLSHDLGRFDLVKITFPSPNALGTDQYKGSMVDSIANRTLYFLGIISRHLNPGGTLQIVTEIEQLRNHLAARGKDFTELGIYMRDEVLKKKDYGTVWSRQLLEMPQVKEYYSLLFRFS